MKTNVIFRILEHAIKGHEDKCLVYCEKAYDLLPHDENEMDKNKFLDCCRSYFHPEDGKWATQD